MKKANNILKQLMLHLFNEGYSVSLCTEHSMLEINQVCTCTFEKKAINISFEVSVFPTFASILTKNIADFSNTFDIELRVCEPFAYVIENDVIVKVLFGKEAFDYFNTGEIKESKIIEKKKPLINEDEKMDFILDKINKKGMESLTRSEKQFLNKISNKK